MFTRIRHHERRTSPACRHIVCISIIATMLLNGQTAGAQFVARDEKKAEVLCTLAEAEFAKGQLDKAKGYYLEANLYNNTDARAMLGLAAIAEKVGNLDEAIRRARLAAQFDSSNANVHGWLASYLQENQDFRGAELQYERAVDLTKAKQDRVVFCSKAIKCLIALEDFEKADKLSKSWLKDCSKYAESHYDRGLVLMNSERKENQEEALIQLSKALQLDPKLNIAHFQLGVLQGKMGRKDQAVKELSLFIKSNPAPGELKLAQDEMEKLKTVYK